MTQSLNGSIETISHQADRLAIQIDDSFDGFGNRYEQAVTVFQSERFDSLVEAGRRLADHSGDASGRSDGTPSPGPTIGGQVTADRPRRGHPWKASTSPARCSIRCPSGSTQRCCPK
jgi:hypothetical protein